jgi:hypothetical protein
LDYSVGVARFLNFLLDQVDDDARLVVDFNLDRERAFLLGGTDGAGDVGLRDMGWSAAHFFFDLPRLRMRSRINLVSV